jgi:hypothetical protein
MQSLIHADIFFFVSTIALVVLTIGGVIILVYIIKIIRDVSHVSGRVKEESDEILNDVKTLRGNIKSEGFKFSFVHRFFRSIFGRRSSKKK